MKLSTRARYAIRSMVEFARKTALKRPVSITSIARSTNISRRYLEQIVISLKNADLLRSIPGRYGGYLLTRPSRNIFIGEIVAATIGPINIVECVGNPLACMKADTCECRTVYTLINQGINHVLNDFTLNDMLNDDTEATCAKPRFKRDLNHAGRKTGSPGRPSSRTGRSHSTGH